MRRWGGILDNIGTPVDLLKLPKLGRKSYTEVNTILNQMIREHKSIIPEQKELQFAALGNTIIKIITEAYNEVTAGDSEVKAYLQAAYPHPSNMHFLVMGEVDHMLNVIKEYSRNENLEIRYSYKQFIEKVLHEMENAQVAVNSIYKEYKAKEFGIIFENGKFYL